MENLDYQVTRELEGKLDSLINALSRGSSPDYPEYCKLVGEIRGVRYALDTLTNLRKQAGAEEET
jgi:hypothetical protein